MTQNETFSLTNVVSCLPGNALECSTSLFLKVRVHVRAVCIVKVDLGLSVTWNFTVQLLYYYEWRQIISSSVIAKVNKSFAMTFALYFIVNFWSTLFFHRVCTNTIHFVEFVTNNRRTRRFINFVCTFCIKYRKPVPPSPRRGATLNWANPPLVQ